MKIAATHNAYGAFSFNRGTSLENSVSKENMSSKTTTLGTNSGNLQSQQVHDLKKMASNLGKEKVEEKTLWQGNSKTSTISSLQTYSDSLRSQRNKAKDTTNTLKTLKYQYKNISSKILRSKTSANANQVASQARREVLRLKRQKLSKDADVEELEAAITHAKSMERIAKKKARHLQEEEMAKAAMLNHPEDEEHITSASDNGYTDDADFDETANEEYASGEENYSDDLSEEAVYGEESSYEAVYDDAMYSQLAEEYDAVYEVADAAMLDMMELMDDFNESMQDLMEEMGLDELLDTFETIKKDLTPEELKEITIKHRNKEMKDMVKADADYLKVIFDKMSRSAATPVSSPVSTPAAAPVSIGTASPSFEMPPPSISITV